MLCRVKVCVCKFCVIFETGREMSFSLGTRWCVLIKFFVV